MDPLIPGIEEANTRTAIQFENPFQIEDLDIFDDDMLRVILSNCGFGLTVEKLARSLHGVNEGLIQRMERNLLSSQRSNFIRELRKSIPEALIEAVRGSILDGLFCDMTYWMTPDLYYVLIVG